ncbi:MAG: hypothetical protein GF364_00190 [Candidatus Lokiarchaeota archaeon]|nr:hypothetical protein [Candidatus Lokiarchaeota archaeon]
MSDNITNKMVDNIFYLDTFREISTLIEFNKENPWETTIEHNSFVIKDTIGSELEIFLDTILKQRGFSKLTLNLTEERRSNDKEELIESKFLSKISNYLQVKQNESETESHEDEQKQDEQNDSEIEHQKEEGIDTTNQEELGNENVVDIINGTEKAIILEIQGLTDEIQIKWLQEILWKFSEIIKIMREQHKPVIPIMLVIFSEISAIPRNILDNIDLILNIPYPDNIERLNLLEGEFNKLGVHTVDISKLSELTSGWNIQGLKKLVKAGYLKWKMINFRELRDIKEKEVKKENKDETEETTPTKIKTDENQKENEDETEKENKTEEDEEKDETKSQAESNAKDNQNSTKENIEKVKDEEDLKIDLGYIVPFTIDIFEDLIENGDIRPMKMYPDKHGIKRFKHSLNLTNAISQEQHIGMNFKNSLGTKKQKQSPSYANKSEEFSSISENDQYINLLRGTNITEINSFNTAQLYQFAAANNFEELMNVLEKLDQGRKLDDLDRKILADYAFVLKDKTKTALSKLTNAKNRIDRIKKISEFNEEEE